MDEEFDCISSKTLVFWDVDDFPVPLGKSIDFFRKKMETSLFIEGYKGDVKFIVYSGKKSVDSKDHLRYLKMDLQEVDEKHSRLYCMLVDMVASAYYNPIREAKAINFMVIAKDSDAEESEFVSTLGELKKRDYNVFLVVPDDCSTLDQAPFPDAHLVWHWSQLFDGEEAQFCTYDSDSDCDEVSSLLERSKISDVDCEEE